MSDRIVLTGIRAEGFHGVFDHERREGQIFSADLDLELSLADAAASDDVADTVDYGAVAEAASAVLAGEPRNLIETVAADIAARVLQFDRVEAVTVTVHKPQAPITVPFDDVAVTIRRSRP